MRWLLLLLLLLPLVSGAADPTTANQAANELFWKGSHAEAAKAYRLLAEAQPASADLWYNLGTAEARAGQLGRAIHALEQALLLDPEDEDTTHNLDQVRNLATERGLVGAGDNRIIAPGGDDVGTGLLMAISENLLTVSFAVTWVLLFVLLFLWRRATRPAMRTMTSFIALIMGLLAIASGGILLARAYTRSQLEFGVVLNRVSVRAGPGDDYARGVVLAEGVKVRLRGTDAGWRQLTLPDGAEGWVPQVDVGVLKRP